MNRKSAVGLLAITLATFSMANSAQAQVIASDNFQRADSTSLGVTPIGGYTWLENETSDEIGISNNAAYLKSRVSGGNPSAMLAVSLLDVDISMTITSAYTVSDNYDVGIMYRTASTASGFPQYNLGGGNSGYAVDLSFQAGTIKLLWGNTQLAIYGPAGTLSGTDPYVLRVTAIGSEHTIYLNGTQILQYTDLDPTHAVAGAVGMGSYYGTYNVSNFTVAVPEPGTYALLALGGIVILTQVRKRLIA